MGQLFTAAIAFIIQLFSAAERVASAANNLATWADEASGTFTDKARHDRNMAVQEMLKEQNITELPKAERKVVQAPKLKA